MPRPPLQPGSAREFTRVDNEKDAKAPGYVYTSLAKDSQRAEEVQPEEEDQLSGNWASMQEYNAIVKNATAGEDIAADCWGALFFIIVNDFPDLKVNRIDAVGKARFMFSMVVFSINLFIQGMLLYCICKLLMMPGMLSAQNLYKFFTDTAFSDGELDERKFEDMTEMEKEEICGLALSQAVFVRVILFLWITNNVGELRNNYTKLKSVTDLPVLPEDLDMRLMVKDGSEGDDGGRVVCLNQGTKMMLVVFIFVPKFIISVALSFLGCMWLMSAENIGDLILNSLALAFVVSVDELIALVFFPGFYLEDLSKLGLAGQLVKNEPEVEKAIQLRSFCYSSMTLITAFLVVELAVRYQPVIPNFDTKTVENACLAFNRNQVPWCMPGQDDCFPES